MKKFNRPIIYVLSLTSIISLVGYSSFLVVASNKDYPYTLNNFSNDIPVAYLSTNPNIKYTRLEKAIDAANTTTSNVTIFIIPNSNAVLNETRILNSNVTLALPYEGENVFSVNKDSSGKDAVSGVEAINEPDKYEKNKLTIKNTAQLINNGTIYVGGIIGGMGGGNNPSGQTSSYFGSIYLEGYNENGIILPQIINNGIIKNQGLITSLDKENILIENNAGSKTETNMVIWENRGGSAFVGLGGGLIDAGLDKLEYECSPFLRLNMPNIAIKSIYNYGSTVNGIGTMFGNDAHNQTLVPLYGNNDSYFIQSKNNSYLIAGSFNRTNENILRNNLPYTYQYIDLDFYGAFDINTLKLSISAPGVGERKITTEGVMFPITYFQDITFNTFENNPSTINANQDLKVMPGGSLFLNDYVTLNVDDLAIYDSYTDTATFSGFKYPSSGFDGGLFTVNGELNVKNIGGDIKTSSINGKLNINSSSNIVSKEVSGTWSTGSSSGTYQEIALNARGLTSNNINENLSIGSYTSNGSQWIKDLSFNLDPASYTQDSSNALTLTIGAVFSDIVNVSKYEWSYSTNIEGIGTLVDNEDGSATISINQNTSTDNNYVMDIKCVVTLDDGRRYEAEGTYTVPKVESSEECLVKGTKVLCEGLIEKPVEELEIGDLIYSYNHFRGKLETKKVAVIYISKARNINILRLNFNNDTSIDIWKGHLFLDYNLRKYVEININNVEEYMCHEFGIIDLKTNKIEKIKIKSYSIYNDVIEGYGICTENNLNHIVNYMPLMTDEIDGIFNYFELDENLLIDRNLMKKDIEKYGLFTYEDWKEYLTLDEFNAFNVKYLTVSIGKGNTTFKELLSYKEKFLRNNKV